VPLKGLKDPQGVQYEIMAWWGAEGPLGEKSITQQSTFPDIGKFCVMRRWVTAEGKLGQNTVFELAGKGKIEYSTVFTKKS
jgi:hypothetical protein